MDRYHASWILEFILRQPIPEWLAKEVLREVPTPPGLDDPHLKKTILLRRIRSDLAERRLSEEVLRSLELVEDIDRSLGDQEPSEEMRSAYCAVAVECTAMALRESGGAREPEGFFEAVRRIWSRRVADLERSPAARRLVSERLREWRRDMEEAVVNPVVRASLLQRDTEGKALEALGEYLRRALEDMGPPLLEMAAREFCVMGKGSKNGGKRGVESGAPSERHVSDGAGTMESDRPSSEIGEMAAREFCVMGKGSKNGGKRGVESGAPSERHVSDEAGTMESDRPSSEIGRERTTRVQETEMQVGSRWVGQENASNQVGHNSNEFNRLPTPEVKKVKDALNSSCVDLQKSVEDPLPDALEKAAGVQSGIAEKLADLKKSEQEQNQADMNEPGPVDKGNQLTSTGGTVVDEHRGKDREGMQHPSLMDRNPTAHTHEWDEDSIEFPSEKSPDSSKRPHLPTPRTRVVSPLKLQEIRKFVRRRKFKRWTPLEEDTLREGVMKHGKGNWKLILQSYPEMFEERTEVDLKDKWRNMTK